MHVMGFYGSAIFAWLFVIGGVGVPVGVPPLPEDPATTNIAPEKCLVYVSSAGTAVADPTSANQTEQLFAEPEVRRMAAEIERAVRDGFQKVAERGELPENISADGLVDMAKILLTRPLAAYISEVQMHPGGPIIRGGVAVNCGDNVDKVKTALEQIAKEIPPRIVGKIQIDGEKWMSFKATPNVTIVWGFQEKHFFAGVGEGEVEAMLQRAKGSPPKWLDELRKKLPVERTSTVTYVDTKAIMRLALPMAGPQAAEIADVLGFSNVTSLESVTGLDQKAFVAKTLWSIDGEAKGFFRLANIEPLTPADLAIIPRDATFAGAFKLDATAMFDLISSVVETIDPRAKEGMDREIALMEKHLALKLRDDVLGPLGDTWRVFDSPGEGGAISGLTAILPLKDPKRAAATHDQLIKLPLAWLNAREERSGDFEMEDNFFPVMNRMRLSSMEFKGNKIYVFDGGMFGPPCTPSWCITDKELIVALNPQNIKGYLSRGADFKSLAQLPEVAELFQGDSGPLKFAYCNSRRMFDVFYPMTLIYGKYVMSMLRMSGVDLDTSIIPSARAIRPHLTPSVISAWRVPSGIEIVERRTMPGPSMSTAVPVGVAMLLPAVKSSRQSARRPQSINNLKCIALAILNHESASGSFPPAYIADKDGKPLLSWRVKLLPHLDRSGVYDQFHLDEPWDSEHNKKLIDKMPSIYRSPASKVADQGKTNYLTVRGEGTIFPGKEGMTFGKIRDGSSNTLMTVEVSDKNAVIWTKPDDFQYDEKDPKKGLIGLWPGGFHAGFADGSVRFFQSSIDPKVLNALFTRAGGEAVSSDDY